jgi:hypothetical protein
LLPHLISLREGYSSLQEEVQKYKAKGWYGLYSHPPFLPFRVVPKGSTPRKLEPERPRPTTEAGAPRKALVDSDSLPVISLNEASSGIPPEATVSSGTPLSPPLTQWPKENKPTVADALVALAVLISVSLLVGSSPVFAAADDFKNFFNQLMLAPEEYWKCCMVLTESLHAVFATEYIMTFGLRPASNIAQRFADSILHLFRIRMDAEDAPHLALLRKEYPGFDAWCKRRRGQIRLYAAFIYTDDPLFLAISPERMARVLKVWTTLCVDLGLMMAIPEKRQCGTHVLWLGAGISATLGLAWVPLPKLRTALSRLSQVLNGTITIGDYHSLLGLLEHLVFLNSMRRSIMYGLWEPFRRGVALEPNRLLIVTAVIRRRCTEWIELLTSRAAVSALRAVKGIAIAPSALVFTLYSDAATDRESDAGLGGWMHGLWWSLQLRGQYLSISIPALEFIAAIVSLFTFSEHLPMLNSEQHVLHMRVDALATPIVLTEDAASSRTLMALHSMVLAHPTYESLAPLLATSQVYGVGNELADAASRDDQSRLARLSSQLNVSPTRCEPHMVCYMLLECALSVVAP